MLDRPPPLRVLRRADGSWMLFAEDRDDPPPLAEGTARWDAERNRWSRPTLSDYAVAVRALQKAARPSRRAARK